jgi:hypothetical protein
VKTSFQVGARWFAVVSLVGSLQRSGSQQVEKITPALNPLSWLLISRSNSEATPLRLFRPSERPSKDHCALARFTGET